MENKSRMTGDIEINYEELAQDALRSVVRTVMKKIEKIGELPGEHHFFIAFDTQEEGVNISKRLMEQYPDEMTIVLQHQFWDLKVEEDYFEVKLSFNSIPERLVIPYKSLKVFFDPSVPYGLQFGSSEIANDDELPDAILPDLLDDKTDTATLTAPLANFSQSNTQENVEKGNVSATNEESAESSKDDSEDGESKQSAEIVSLDTFRNKS